MGEIQHNMIFKLVKEERTITNINKNSQKNGKIWINKVSVWY